LGHGRRNNFGRWDRKFDHKVLASDKQRGGSIVGTGTGTQSTPNQRGVAKVTAEGTMWTSAPGLSHLNGGRWRVEGEVNTIRETVDIRGNFETTNG
jgi:hypothetical protein